MHARYYGVKMGRFVSVDPGFDVNPHAPRSWNLYAYVRNNPTRYYDKTGEGLVDKLYGTAQGILGSVSWGMMPNTAPSPLDTPDQREGQLWGAALAAWAGLEVGKAGVSIALAGGAGAILTAGEATAVAAPVVATGVAAAGVGATVVAGAAQYVAFATSKTEHGEQRHQEARDGDTHREVGDANRVKREGRLLIDTYDKQGNQVSQFTNSRANTQRRIAEGKWMEPTETVPTGGR